MSKHPRHGQQQGGGVRAGGQSRPRDHGRQGSRQQSVEVLFDPEASPTELVDSLAERQAGQLQINSAQLRRFFGEIKDLYRRYNALAAADAGAKDHIYHEQIEPMFKMIRSKVSYATHPGGQRQLPKEFAEFLKQGIARVRTAEQFQRFVLHVEAVVGFMYGKGKVSR